jgi:hypothetical protein
MPPCFSGSSGVVCGSPAPPCCWLSG